MTVPTVLLLGTSACHLCEQAERLLQQAQAARPLQWQAVDIALDDALVSVYGTRIPVLRQGDRTLDWPFSLLDILSFIQ